MAVTVEELQIVLQCDATQAQAALNSLNASVDKAVKKMNSGGGKGGASYYETVSKKIQAAMEKASEAMDEFESTGDSGAKANLGHYTTEANKLAKELQKCRDAASLMFGEKKPYFCEINVMPGIEGIEKASGVNVAGEIMRTIREDFEK